MGLSAEAAINTGTAPPGLLHSRSTISLPLELIVTKTRAILGIALGLGLAGLGYGVWHAYEKNPPTRSGGDAPGAASTRDDVQYVPTHVVAAMTKGEVDLEMRGDGRFLVQITARNRGREPIELVFQSGMVLVSENQLAEAMIPREASIFLKPGEATRQNLEVVPGSCRNERRVRNYLVSVHRYELLEPWWDYLSMHPEVGSEAVRTGTLIIKENLPLSAFAKFDLATGAVPETLRGAGLEVEMRYIMEALFALEKAGYPEEGLAVLVDPQLQLEALLDPLTRAAAKRYFALTDSDEWELWEHQLKAGNPATRHYSLYAIARYYPDVAVQMLPRWARFQEMSLPMRRAAILALAEVRRPEAGALLAQLEHELGASPALGDAAMQAMNYWDAHVNLPPTPEMVAGLAFQDDAGHLDVEMRGENPEASQPQTQTAPTDPMAGTDPQPAEPEAELEPEPSAEELAAQVLLADAMQALAEQGALHGFRKDLPGAQADTLFWLALLEAGLEPVARPAPASEQEFDSGFAQAAMELAADPSPTAGEALIGADPRAALGVSLGTATRLESGVALLEAVFAAADAVGEPQVEAETEAGEETPAAGNAASEGAEAEAEVPL